MRLWVAVVICVPAVISGAIAAVGVSHTVAATRDGDPTSTPEPQDLELTGRVYDANVGPTAGIGGATVSVLSCFPRRFPTTSDVSGHYQLFVPASYLTPCTIVMLEAAAPGYVPLAQTVAASALYASPERDLGLAPLRTQAYLALIRRSPPAGVLRPPAFAPSYSRAIMLNERPTTTLDQKEDCYVCCPRH